MSHETLTSCPNPARTIFIGRLMLSVQFASDYWAHGQKDGLLHREYFSVNKVTDQHGVSMINIVVHRLLFATAWAK